MVKRTLTLFAILLMPLLLAGNTPVEPPKDAEVVGSMFLTTVISKEIIECTEDKNCPYHEVANRFVYEAITSTAKIVAMGSELTRVIREAKKEKP